MTVPEMDMEPTEQDAFRYEALRLRIVENDEADNKGSLGLALFIRQGMLAWVNTWRDYVRTSCSAKKQAQESSVIPYKAQLEITKVLANMTLRNLGESV